MGDNQRSKGLIMKNLLRKLHIGNGSGDHYDRLDEERTSPETTQVNAGGTSAATTSTSSSSSSTSPPEAQHPQQRHSGFGWRRRTGTTTPASRPGGSTMVAPSEGSVAEIARQAEIFNALEATGSAMMAMNDLHAEEEYQVQLALALSVSKSDGIDPEVVEIEAAKRISLGLSPSPDSKLAEVITGRYWAYNLLSYDDKVVDGFYDVYTIYSGAVIFDKLPSIAELQETEISDSINYEVIYVNRVFDPDLLKLEQRATCLRLDCSVLDSDPIRNGLAQRIAELVIDEMGGVVTSDIDILTAWRNRGWELRAALQSIVWPLGALRFGLARHRALLFKVLADCVNLPCRLVKGKHYTGVEDGVLNILKDSTGREYIIDLMGTPGTLIPLDVTVTSYTATSSKVIKNGETREATSSMAIKNGETTAPMVIKNGETGGYDGSNAIVPTVLPGSNDPMVVVAVKTSEPEFQTDWALVDLGTVNTEAEAASRSGSSICKSSLDHNHVQKRKENIAGSPSAKHRPYNRHSSLLEDVSEWEINWEHLNVGERIGIGSYGEVYHGEWSGTEVAIKKFLDQDLSGDAMDEFRSEVQIMRRLSHPNVVLFMGAVAHPPNLAIVTEYLPRGSLFKLLHKPYNQLDRRRRLQMALDVAKGMNYLHSATPVVVHRDLKSPNLLVDRNWVVKVCDFGLSRIKHSTFLSSKSTAGTPEWMAPEVLRNEPSNEKSDVFSFGVILWELATSQKPWHGMNPMQVVGAVGFQHRRLTIPAEVDPSIASIIHECWQNDPNLRPSFEKIVNDLQVLQRPVLVAQPSSSGSGGGGNSFKANSSHQLKIHYQQQLHAVPLKGVAFNVEGVGTSHVSHINALDFAVRAHVP